MPVRKVPHSHRSLTGRFASTKNTRLTEFESGLERDFLFLLEFDEAVASFEEQPVTIVFTDPFRLCRQYTPDVLVSYVGDQPPELCEIKYLNDLKENRAEYGAKFRAAQQYAVNLGWRFRIVTERKIRGVRLDNAKFLLPYRNMICASESIDLVFTVIQEWATTGEATVEQILNRLTNSRTKQAELFPVLWHLLALGRLKTDLNQPLLMSSHIQMG